MSPRRARGLPLSELPNADEDAALAEQDRARRERRRRRQRRSATVLVVTLALFGVAAYVVIGVAKPVIEGFFESDDYPGPGSGTVEVQIEAGDTGRAIGQTLQDANVVKTADAFVDVATDDPRAASIQPGTYELRSEMSAAGALEMLLDPSSRVSIRVAVPEGLTVDETYRRLTQATGLPVEQFEEAAAGDIGLPEESGGNPEGYLFPATYEFEPDVTAPEILSTRVARHTQAMDTVGVLPERRREVLIKASLIQDEAQRPEDFGKVARVIENRLAADMPLQFDSTVNFATGKSGITTSAEDRAIDSPYNTYRYPGLPPGPINSPGEQAIEAAVNPTEGNWLYFVAVNPSTGETRFAETAEEHAENVELFRQWLRENES
jgi:UPF0755 protein